MNGRKVGLPLYEIKYNFENLKDKENIKGTRNEIKYMLSLVQLQNFLITESVNVYLKAKC